MIGARLTMFGGAKGLSAKSYVQDGLVAMWDGIENAGWGTHDSSATVWKDLVGDTDFTIYDSSTTFTDQSLKMAYANIANRCATSKNFDFVAIEIYGKYQEGSRILFIDNSSPYRCALIFQTNLTTLQTTNGVTKMFSIGDRSSYNNKMGLSVEYNASYKCNGAVFNGVNRPLIDDSNSWVIPYHNCFSLGARMDWITNVFAGEFFNIRIYNRALTGAEIAHNYAVDKERFGL